MGSRRGHRNIEITISLVKIFDTTKCICWARSWKWARPKAKEGCWVELVQESPKRRNEIDWIGLGPGKNK